jgi:glycosyltransferase involved in cell wall biosynthesis
MRLLHVVASVDPRGGGPMEGVRQRGLRLEQLGHTVEAVTLDDPAAAFVRGFPLKVHAVGPVRSSYGYSAALIPWLEAHAAGYDAIVVNGLWQFHSFAAWRTLRRLRLPYFVFTHGMLDPWFKRAYPLKHLKKWLYWPWVEYRVLRDARAVLFTSEEERLQARRSFWLYRANEEVVAYGTSAPPANAVELREGFLTAHSELRGRRLLLFLSRIHEKKGCDLLVRAFAEIAGIESTLHLVMAGPDQSGVVVHLKQIAADHGLEKRISWPGMLREEMKWGAFYASEAFILPSHQENFGISVAEALGCGLPVLISDKVNIWREVMSHGAGLVAPDSLQGTTRLLRDYLALTPPQRDAMGSNARALFAERFTVSAMADSLLNVIERRLGPRAVPVKSP